MTDADDDAALLDAWTEGDNVAGNRLLERYFERLRVFFGARAERDVEDLVQRTLMSCVRARDSVQRASSFRAFLFTTAKHELIDHYRRRSVERARSGDVAGPEPDDEACERTTPSQFAMRREQRRALGRALRAIDVELQVVIALHYWEGMTNAELAETLEIPLGTVKSRLRRAKEALDEQLQGRLPAREIDETLVSLEQWAERVRAEPDDA